MMGDWVMSGLPAVGHAVGIKEFQDVKLCGLFGAFREAIQQGRLFGHRQPLQVSSKQFVFFGGAVGVC